MPYPCPRFSQPINSQVLPVTMTSRASDLWLSVLDCNDHGSSVCVNGLGMLIDPQNINATVHIIKCSDSNMELWSRRQAIMCYSRTSSRYKRRCGRLSLKPSATHMFMLISFKYISV